MTEVLDFVDVIVPILEAGTWTNYLTTNQKAPQIVTRNKSGPSSGSSRGNKNVRVLVENLEGNDDTQEFTFDGTPIYRTLSGKITLISTSKTDRNLMKKDLETIMKASSLPFGPPPIDNILLEEIKITQFIHIQ